MSCLYILSWDVFTLTFAALCCETKANFGYVKKVSGELSAEHLLSDTKYKICPMFEDDKNIWHLFEPLSPSKTIILNNLILT